MGYQQKSYKKFVATAATATLVASAIVPVASAAGFSDVAENNEFAPYINALTEAGIINGYASDNTFRPSNKLTRGQVAIMLGRWLENNGATVPTDWATNPRFSDVSSSNEELAKYAALVKDTNVFTGVQGKLNPAQNITRENMAVVLDRVATEVAGISLVELAEEIKDVEVKDLKTAQAAYQDEIQALADLEITTVSNFRPKEQLSRAQFAKFLYKTFEIIEEITAPLTAEELKAEVASIVGTLPAVNTITTVEQAQAAKTTATEATTALADIETVVAEGEYTEAEVTELKKVIANAKTSIEAVVAKADQVIEDAKVFEVESVKAVNGKTVEVKFSKPVKKSTVITNSSSTDFLNGTNVKFTTLDGKPVTTGITAGTHATATLSEDGKTLSITAGGTEIFEGRYQVLVENVETTASVKIEKYDEVINLGKDTVAPTIVGTEKVNATTTKVNFSEPIKTAGNFSFKLADGTVVPVVTTGDGAYVSTLSADKKSLTVQIVGTQYTGKTVVATVIGAQDAAGNLLSPNPASFNIQVGNKDGVAPTVTSVTATNDKEFVVNFSEEVQGLTAANFALTGSKLASSLGTPTVTQDANDKKKWTVTYPTSVLASGVTTTLADVNVTVSGISDLSGEAMTTAYRQIVTINKDTGAPTLVSSAVTTEAGVKYLVLNFNEAVSSVTTADSASAVKDYVTANGPFTLGTITPSADNKTMKIALDGNGASLFDGKALVAGTQYNVKLNLKDTSNNTTATPLNVTFTYDGATNTTKPVINNANALSGQSTVAITFDREVDGASATNVANYNITGVTVKSATLSPVTGGTQTVTLTLDTNELSGNRAITVANVKSKAGVAMDAFTGVVTLTENVKPEVKAAKVTGTKTIEVTFSEAIKQGFTTNDDFVLKVGTTTIPVTDYTVQAVTGDATKATITLKEELTAANLAETISLETVVGTDAIVDAADNTVKTGVITVSK